ncbi:hypothetical protein H0H93_011021, partial [Arthromyces matolae]
STQTSITGPLLNVYNHEVDLLHHGDTTIPPPPPPPSRPSTEGLLRLGTNFHQKTNGTVRNPIGKKPQSLSNI